MGFQPGAQKSVSILEKTYIQYLITRTFFKTQNKLKWKFGNMAQYKLCS